MTALAGRADRTIVAHRPVPSEPAEARVADES